MTGQEQTPLDPATITAAHTADADGLCKQHDCEFVGALWPCLPYRLAAELAAMREREQRVREECEEAEQEMRARGISALVGLHHAVRAALAGEGAADQPQRECRHTEHAVGQGGVRGRWFPEGGPDVGEWERCTW